MDMGVFECRGLPIEFNTHLNLAKKSNPIKIPLLSVKKTKPKSMTRKLSPQLPMSLKNQLTKDMLKNMLVKHRNPTINYPKAKKVKLPFNLCD